MSKFDLPITDIQQAKERISSLVKKTPLIRSSALSSRAEANIFLKLENQQVTGSFKLRGAANKILSLSQEERDRGVITVSSGNHGRAVAFVAGSLGLKATIVVPSPVPENKRRAIRELGADLVIEGENADQAMVFANQLQAKTGMNMIHPFDDLAVIAGQGTIGLEIYDDLPEIDTIIVPLSGGGLMSGIAATLKTIKPSIYTVGVTMESGAAMFESLKAGKIVDIVETPTLADALAGGLNPDNRYTFAMVQEFVDETILVTEGEIAAGIAFCYQDHRLTVEGGGAVGVSALLANKMSRLGKNSVIVISGGNISDLALKTCLLESDEGE